MTSNYLVPVGINKKDVRAITHDGYYHLIMAKQAYLQKVKFENQIPEQGIRLSDVEYNKLHTRITRERLKLARAESARDAARQVVPPPASRAAIDEGCTCPLVPNRFGKGDGGIFTIYPQCAVHKNYKQ